MNAIFQTLVEHPLVELLGWTLLHSIWQAAAIALPLAVMLRVLRHKTASLRYGIACVGMFPMALLPAVTFLKLVANS
ncbi:MAG TPA: hypothetical protein PKD54_10505, partial [Pirellulaceae bacterium]|nr:hypothetical protein [Pirellulaceae bacterium]